MDGIVISNLDHESVLTGQDLRFSEAFQGRCFFKEASSRFGRKINLDSACSIHRIDTSKIKIHGALIDTILSAKLLIAFDDKDIQQLKNVPNKNKHREKEKFPSPKTYKGLLLNFCKTLFAIVMVNHRNNLN
ncbi:MAG: hypothetical protein ACJA0H_000943 [Francisellaceae bacterium]|jgi:hypothetical protein